MSHYHVTIGKVVYVGRYIDDIVIIVETAQVRLKASIDSKAGKVQKSLEKVGRRSEN